jgi:hypothetical protein
MNEQAFHRHTPTNVASWMIAGGLEPENGSLQHQRIHLATLRAEGRLDDGALARLGRFVSGLRALRAPTSQADPACCPA